MFRLLAPKQQKGISVSFDGNMKYLGGYHIV